jgi:starch phosphorylase
MNNDEIAIAYFSMKIGLESVIPTNSGGLGVLAGDTLRSAADAGLAMAGITRMSSRRIFNRYPRQICAYMYSNLF